MKFILVNGKDLEVGDCIQMGREILRIMNISRETIWLPKQEFMGRWAYGRDVLTGAIQPLALTYFSLREFKVVGGAKLDAARAGRAKMFQKPSGMLWEGYR